MQAEKPAYHKPHYSPHIDHLLPVLEAFALVGLRVTKGYEEINKGRLKAVKNGSRTYVRASEVERYIGSLTPISVKEAA